MSSVSEERTLSGVGAWRAPLSIDKEHTMDSGFYAACAGLRAQSQALDVAAHNVANVSTTGFRGQQASFQTLLALARPAASNPLNLTINNFGVLEGSHLDLSAGSLQATGSPLDLGIEGKGFFAIQTPQGTRYTRDGSFRVARTGELVTAAGNPVLGENGVIRVPAGPLSISSDGTLSVNGAVAGKIRQVEFAPDTQLASDGNALLSAPKGSEVPARETAIRQGMLETSNVDAIHSVITLIGVQRQAEMMQRALSLFHTEFNRIASNDLPRVS
jgi:flagellar basal-body rod protein FlgF/flagellar basal-body rod protein FlgG